MQKTQATLTKADLNKIQSAIKDVLKAHKNGVQDKEYIELLQQIVKTLHELKVSVEFDHERRLQAIEDFLQDL